MPGFEKFGKTGYISQTKIIPFLTYLEKGQLYTTRCRDCNRTYFPPRADCVNCRSNDVEWIPLNGNAKLVTFTEVFFAPPTFQPEAPYLLGVAELENGLRVFAPISGEVRRAELNPGLELTLRPEQAGGRVFYELGKMGTRSSKVN